jgi:undecaprenyl-diphosphatase
MWREKLKRNEVWLALAGIFTVAVLISGVVTDNYLDQEGLTRLDRPINQWVVSLRTPLLNKLMYLITLTGNWQMIVWGSFLAAILLIAAKKRRYLAAMLLSNVSAWIFIEAAKNLVGRTRPPVENALMTEPGFAFPSGHSYFAVVFYGLMTYFWVRHFHQRWTKIGIFILGSGSILCLAVSRIYLGVHWTTDVVAGLSLSLAWLSVTVAYIEYKRRFFKEEFKEFNKKLVWSGFAVFMGLWFLGLLWLYSNNINILGIKMINPMRAAVTAMTRTAPAAKSRGKVVSEY